MTWLAGPQPLARIPAVVHLGDQPGDSATWLEAVDALDELRQPGEWGRILVRPGTYAEQWGSHPFTQVEALGEVIVERPLTGLSGSSLATWIGSYLFAGIHFRLPSGVSPASATYALHHHAERGPAVFDQCTFTSLDADYATAAGADTAGNAITTFNQCTFHPHSGGATNLHGDPTANRAARYVLRGCTMNGQTGYSDLGSGMADEFWFIGGSAPSILLSGAHVHGVIDQAACSSVTVQNGATYDWYDPDVHTVPPIWDTAPA